MRAKCLISVLSLAAVSALGGCNRSDDPQPAIVSVIGETGDFSDPLKHSKTAAARLLLGATAQGLVALDDKGEVVPALAQRWIVADEGRSYIFRLRRISWVAGKRVEAGAIARMLDTRIRAAAKADPYGNMAAVDRVKAMTGDVIEIRLNAPRPNFLTMLAQPQLALMDGKAGGSGPYDGRRMGNRIVLMPVNTPEGDPAPPSVGRIVRSERASKAVARYALGFSDLVLGGTLADLPFVLTTKKAGPTALQYDPAHGLFGLAITGDAPLLQSADVRAALSMALDREQLVQQLAPGGWSSVATLMPAQFNLASPPTQPSWAALPIEDRRRQAAAVIAAWTASHGGSPPSLTLALGEGPGYRALFRYLRAQFAQIGIQTVMVHDNGDLTLIDEVAPYDSGFWYLGRISCAKAVSCDSETEEMLKQAATTQSTPERSRQLSAIEARMARHGGFIPLATPLRWALVGKRITNWIPSARAWHPLAPLTLRQDDR